VREDHPFPHVYLEDLFAPEFYLRLLSNLPPTEAYRELPHRDAMQPDGRSTRRKFYLFPEHIRLLPRAPREVLSEVSSALLAPALQDAFKHKFCDTLERRFGRRMEELSFYPVPMLLRDFPGYRIGIHGDSLSKAITAQFYLPLDASQSHLGTILHEGRDGEAAGRAKRLPFRPATGYAFPVMYHESWHSVAQTGPGDGARNSIMLTYYVQDRAIDWVGERLKRYWLWIARGFRR
jgi:hypothetical protein